MELTIIKWKIGGFFSFKKEVHYKKENKKVN